MNAKNKVIDKYTAIVDGVQTGLAGCTERCVGCLRGDVALDRSRSLRAESKSSPHGCKVFIPTGEAAQ